jgi:hypothetical protein
MGEAAELDLTRTEWRLLRQLRLDGAPVGVVAQHKGDLVDRAAYQLRARGLVDLWPGRGWFLTDAGHAVVARMLEEA